MSSSAVEACLDRLVLLHCRQRSWYGIVLALALGAYSPVCSDQEVQSSYEPCSSGAFVAGIRASYTRTCLAPRGVWARYTSSGEAGARCCVLPCTRLTHHDGKIACIHTGLGIQSMYLDVVRDLSCSSIVVPLSLSCVRRRGST